MSYSKNNLKLKVVVFLLITTLIFWLVPSNLIFGEGEGGSPPGDGQQEIIDTTPPVITLNGANPVKVEVGSTYVDAGATASDIIVNDDLSESIIDLTSSITVVNTVDTTTVGSYQVTYNVSDSAGNAATEITRTVIVDPATSVVLLSPSLSTDKADYGPEQTVIITGTGFAPNAIYKIVVARPDGHVDEWSALSDGSGDLITTYQLDGIEGIYTVTATDGTNTATTTFTDAPKVEAVWSDSDCANIAATADVDKDKSYYVTYADPDGVVRGTSPTYSGVKGFTDYFVLDITLPKVLGKWTVRLYETPATLKDTDDKGATIDKMVWTTDSTYAAMKTSFAQGETVYMKAIGLSTTKYYKFMLKPPVGSDIYVGAWTTGVTTLTGSYALSVTAPTGEWELHVREADDATGKKEGHYVDRYFTVTPYTPPSDTTPPTLTKDLAGTLGLNGWYTSDVTVTLTGADAVSGSGVAKVEYSTDGGLTWTTYTDPFVLEGTTTLYHKVTDNAGNIYVLPSQTIKIDKTDPTLTKGLAGTSGTAPWWISDVTVT